MLRLQRQPDFFWSNRTKAGNTSTINNRKIISRLPTLGYRQYIPGIINSENLFPSQRQVRGTDDGDSDGGGPSKKPKLDGGDTSGKRKNDNDDGSDPKRQRFEENTKIPSEGSKSAQHGNIFQLKLLMLFLLRASERDYTSFRLATELADAEKFDDMVFQYVRDNVRKLRLFQAKHKEGATPESELPKIKETDLLTTDSDEPFSLPKYFQSYLKILQRAAEESAYSMFSKSVLEDILIVTNTDFDSGTLQNYFEVDRQHGIEVDPLLKIDKSQNPKWKDALIYKLKDPSNSALVSRLKPILENTSDFYRLVEEVADCILTDRSVDKSGLFKDYYYPLVRDVFDFKREGKSEQHLEFLPKFLDGNALPKETTAFRNALIKEVTFVQNKETINLSGTFGKSELPNNDGDIGNLAKKLAEFAERKTNKDLTVSDFSEYHVALMQEVITPGGKFRSGFLNSGKGTTKQKLRDRIKEEIAALRKVKKITNEQLKSVDFQVSANFGESKLPEDRGTLEKLAKTIVEAINNKAELKPSLSAELQHYHVALAKEVIDTNTKKFQETFVQGKVKKGSNVKPLPTLTSQFRKMLVDKMVPIDNTKTNILSGKKIKATKGFVDEFRPGSDIDINNIPEFAAQLRNLLESGTSENIVEINERSVPKDKQHAFEANMKKLAGYVLTNKFKKIRFSSTFLYSTSLPGNLDGFRKELKGLLENSKSGKIKFDDLYVFEFDIKGLKFKTCEDGALNKILPVLHNNNDVASFFDNFKFVVNYPNRKELTSLVTGELQNTFKEIDGKISHSLYLETMHDWMADRIGTFYTPNKAKELFITMRKDIALREVEGITKYTFSKFSSEYEFVKNYDSIVDFLKSTQKQVFHVSSTNVELSCVKMTQILQDLRRKPNPGDIKTYVWSLGHIFISLDQLKDKDMSQSVLEYFKSKANLLIIESSGNSKDISQLHSELSQILNDPKKKIILIGKAEGNDLANKFAEANSKYQVTKDENSFASLTKESQQRLLDADVMFQGQKVKLKNLLDERDASLTGKLKSNTLYEIMVDKKSVVGNDLSLGEINDYYIPRTFVDEVHIEKRVIYTRKEDYFPISDMMHKETSDYFVINDVDGDLRSTKLDYVFVVDKNSAEAKFNEVHRRNSRFNVHLLRNEGGKLIWQKTAGSIANLVEYRAIENVSGKKTTNLNENQLIDDKSGHRTVIISDKPGMGKSTVLSDLAIKLKENHPELWVVRVDLNDYSDQLAKMKSDKKSFSTKDEAVTFLLNSLSDPGHAELTTDLEKLLFPQSFDKEGKIALLFDGFDEISPNYKDLVVDLLLQLKQSKLKKMYVTTRLNMRQALEEKLGEFSHTLEPFTKQNQRDFLMKFWQKKLDLSQERLDKYVTDVVNNLSIVNGAKENFAGIPLQLRMIAENFQDTVQKGDELPTALQPTNLYEEFIKKKYEIFVREKEKQQSTNPARDKSAKILYDAYIEDHQLMALDSIIKQKDLKILLERNEKKKLKTIMDDIKTYHEKRGLISEIINGKPQFVHRTFAEFFVAKHFVNELNDIDESSKAIQDFILTKILVDPEYKVVRAFINDQLTVESSGVIGDTLNELWRSQGDKDRLRNSHNENILHVSAEEGHANIFKYIVNSLSGHEDMRGQLLDARGASDLTPAETAAVYDRREVLEWLQDSYNYRKVNIQDFKSELLWRYMGFDDVQEAQRKLQEITMSCLFRFSRRRRSGKNKCLFSWEDVDRIAKQSTRNLDEVRIDSERFLEYTKSIDDDVKNSQLLDLVQQIKKVNVDNVVGKRKHLLDQVISDEGFKNYLQEGRINELAGNTIRDSKSKMSPVLRERIINAAGKVQLTMGAYGVYSTVMTCIDGSGASCALSISSLGYSFLTQPIESALVKITPRVVSQTGKVGARIIPRVLGHDAKFIIQVTGMKYGAKIAKGVAGALGGVFDIVDAAISTKALIDCDKRKNTKDKCSEKEIRDNIASISFAGISFIVGIALAGAGASFGLSVAVGFVIMAASILYSGISNIIEYKEKYGTTTWENFRIFWHTVAFQPMPKDVIHLSARTEYVNSLTESATSQLKNMTDNIVGYAFGLGEVVITDDKPSLVSGSSYIDLTTPNKKSYSLSRVLPKGIDGVEMICLPKKTSSNYELSEENRNSHKSAYYCENAVAIVLNKRWAGSNKDSSIFYDLTNINNGFVQGKNSTQNIFYLKQGKPVVRGGRSTINSFVFGDSNFAGYIQVDNNSTNVIDFSEPKNLKVTLSWKQEQPLYTYLTATMSALDKQRVETVSIEKYQREAVISFKSTKDNFDVVNCTMMKVYMDHNLLIDAGGGLSEERKDELVGCTDAVVWPNTKIEASRGNYTYYVKAQGYEKQKASSDINVIGEGRIVFQELQLIDFHQIRYSSSSNTLSFDLPLSQNGTYTVNLKNYINPKEKSPNFLLVDKAGHYITPKIFDREIIDMFEIIAVYSAINELASAVEHYEKLLSSISSTKGYKVFGLAKFLSKNEGSKQNFQTATFGSDNGDVFVLDDSTVYAKGNQGADVYIVDGNSSGKKYDINNYAKDFQLDALWVPYEANMSLTKDNNILKLNIVDAKDKSKTKTVGVVQYFTGEDYQHLMVTDYEHNSFIPFQRNGAFELKPFYHASGKKNVFILLATVKEAVIDCEFENMAFYKRDDSLLISSKKFNEARSPLTVILKLFYKNQEQWKGLELYSFQKGNYRRVDLNNVQLTSRGNDDVYNQIVKEYEYDYRQKSLEVAHNQIAENGKYVPVSIEKEKIGLLIFKDKNPQNLEVINDKNDLILRDKQYKDQVVIKNWHLDNKYIPSMIEFDTSVEPIRMYISDKDVDLKKMLNDGWELENIQSIIGDDGHRMLKCILAVNSMNVADSYRALGFTHLKDAASFIMDCNFPGYKLSHLRGIKIFLPVKYLQIYSLQLKLQGYDTGNDRRYSNIIWDKFSPILDKTRIRIEVDMALDKEMSLLKEEALQIVEYFLLISCTSYGGRGVLSETLRERPPLNNILEPNLFIKTMLLLMAKSYNEILFKYPDVERNASMEIDYNNLHMLDITIVDSAKNNAKSNDVSNLKTILRKKVQGVFSALSASRLSAWKGDWENYVRQNINNLFDTKPQDVPFSAIKVEYVWDKNRSEEIIKHHRQQRDIADDEFDFVIENAEEVIEHPTISSGGGGTAQFSSINNALIWLGSNLRALKSLNPVNWFSKGIDLKDPSYIFGNISSITPESYGEDCESKCINEEPTYLYADSGQIPYNFGKDASSIDAIDLSFYNVNSTLLLMDVATRKYTGEQFPFRNGAKEDYLLNRRLKEEAQCLAYSYYCGEKI